MDNQQDAFESFGLKTESYENTKERLVEESNNTDSKVKILGTADKQFRRPELLNEDYRDLAVKQRVVPKKYKDARFDLDRIKENLREQYAIGKIYTTHNFYTYYNLCIDILNTIRRGELPQRSYLIGAPNGFGKTSFANECIMTLFQQSFKVAPYISLWELAEIRKADEQRVMKPYTYYKENNTIYTNPNEPKGIIYGKNPEIVVGAYSYSEYINSDCLFVTFTDTISKDVESHALYQLLAIRGVKGLPTIALMSTSLDPYENDISLKEQVWDEIRTYDEKKDCYDRVYHVSCYKFKNTGLNNKGINIESDTGIVS